MISFFNTTQALCHLVLLCLLMFLYLGTSSLGDKQAVFQCPSLCHFDKLCQVFSCQVKAVGLARTYCREHVNRPNQSCCPCDGRWQITQSAWLEEEIIEMLMVHKLIVHQLSYMLRADPGHFLSAIRVSIFMLWVMFTLYNNMLHRQ